MEKLVELKRSRLWVAFSTFSKDDLHLRKRVRSPKFLLGINEARELLLNNVIDVASDNINYGSFLIRRDSLYIMFTWLQRDDACPDVVKGWRETVAFSKEHLERIVMAPVGTSLVVAIGTANRKVEHHDRTS